MSGGVWIVVCKISVWHKTVNGYKSCQLLHSWFEPEKGQDYCSYWWDQNLDWWVWRMLCFRSSEHDWNQGWCSSSLSYLPCPSLPLLHRPDHPGGRVPLHQGSRIKKRPRRMVWWTLKVSGSSVLLHNISTSKAERTVQQIKGFLRIQIYWNKIQGTINKWRQNLFKTLNQGFWSSSVLCSKPQEM